MPDRCQTPPPARRPENDRSHRNPSDNPPEHSVQLPARQDSDSRCDEAPHCTDAGKPIATSFLNLLPCENGPFRKSAGVACMPACATHAARQSSGPVGRKTCPACPNSAETPEFRPQAAIPQRHRNCSNVPVASKDHTLEDVSFYRRPGTRGMEQRAADGPAKPGMEPLVRGKTLPREGYREYDV